jgi:uncharacterized protein
MIDIAKFQKASHLIDVNIDDEFTLLVNPYVIDGLRLLNKSQIDVFKKLDEGKNILVIAHESGKSVKQIEDFITLLSEKKILVENNQPEFPFFGSFYPSIDFWVHTTDSCNLRCQYCYIQTKDSQNSIESSVIEKFLSKIIETVKSKGLKIVTLRLAGGEPFLRFNVWKFYILDLQNKLRSHECVLKVSFLTNLTILTDEIIEFIKSERINVGISLDGLKEFHNKTRPFVTGKGSFDVIFANIRRLIQNDIHPSIMTVVTNDNLDGLEDFTKFLVDHELPFRYSMVQAENFDYDKAFVVFEKIYSFIETKIDNGYSIEKMHKLCDLKLLNIFNQTCGAGLNTGTIYSDGNIYFCQQQVGSQYYIDSIYSDDDLLDIINKGNHFNGQLSSECEKCSFRYICTGGCPLTRVNDKSPSCEFFKKFIPIIYRLIGKERLYQIKNSLS